MADNKKSFFNSVVAMSISQGRVLRHHDLFENIARELFPEKLNIQTLLAVLKSFVQSSGRTLHSMSTDYVEGRRYYVDFEFEGKIWRGTVDNRFAVFHKEEVRFINLKVPNDGFLYSSQYEDLSSQYHDLQFDADAVDLISFIWESIDEKFHEKTWFLYNKDTHKSELYFKSEKESIIFHIGFDYGTPTGFTNKKTYTEDELRKQLELLKRK